MPRPLLLLAVLALGTLSATAQTPASRVALPGIPGSALPGLTAGDHLGWATAPAGDVNGDGYDDLIAGAPGNDAAGTDAGRAYVYFGGPAADAVPDLTLTGEAAGDAFGYSVAGAGDVNGDGYADLVVGASGNDAGGANAGRAYVFFGGAAPNATADLTLTGEAAGGYFGNAVAGAGDVNGDGYDDALVGAYGYASSRGRTYLFLGGPTPDATADLTITGLVSGDLLGTATAGAGDVNGDGFDDIIIGTDISGPGSAGRAFVYFGSASPDATADLTLSGEALDDAFGVDIAGAGDVNGDGFADVIVGASTNSAGGSLAGRAYVFFGGATPDAVADLTITGIAANERFGDAVAGAGDVNGDGFGDVVVGALNSNAGGAGAGQARVYFGGPVPDAVADLTVTGTAAHDALGTAVSAAGDLDGDGLADLAIGVPYDDTAAGTDTGSVLLVSNANTGAGVAEWRALGAGTSNYFGRSVADAGDVNGDGYADSIVGAAFAGTGRATVYFGGPGADAVADLTLTGAAAGDLFGVAVAGAGDLNGDGYDDLVVGAIANDAAGLDAGRAYVFFGGAVPNAVADLTISGLAAGERLGSAVSAAGDVNGDGYGDLVVGSSLYKIGGIQSGRVDVYLGGAVPDAVPDLTVLGATSERLGLPVAAAGDINGDGYADLLAGAAGSNAGGSSAGRAYVYFGGPVPDAVADLTITGTVAFEKLGATGAGAGDVNGDGYDDVLVGTPESDAGAVDGGRVSLFLGGPVPNAVADLTITGTDASGFLGSAVAGAGDVNGDGYADVAIGTPFPTQNAPEAGRVAVYFGGPAPDATADLTLTGEAASDNFGTSVALGPDFNGDGRADVLVGASSNSAAGNQAGAAYLFRATGPAAAPGLFHLVDIPADEGGALDLRWARSDGESQGTVTGYRVERSHPAGPGGYAWETLAVVGASGNPRYSLAAATYTDQTPGVPATACFRVTAAGPGGAQWRSAVRCGASIDNLAPAAPPALAVGRSPDGDALVRVTALASPPADLAVYTVFRSADAVCDAADVPVGSALATGAASVTVEDDATDFGTNVFYCAVATDVHGNASAFVGAATANPAVLAAVRVILQGAYQSGLPGGALMRADLEASLPAVQPYGGPPWNYAGTEALTPALLAAHAVVDWVLVEVRTSPTAPGERAAALLLADGTLLDPATATAAAQIRPATAGAYHVAVYHRTHLAAMSAVAVPLSGTAGAAYDLTAGPAVAYGTQAEARLAAGVFGLVAGDGDGTGTILAPDRQAVWLPQVGQAGYLRGDFNLDGSVLANDRQALWLPNVGRQTQVPGAALRPAPDATIDAADTRP